MSRYKAVRNSSWGESHKIAFGDRTGYLVCKDVAGLPIVATVPNLLNETLEQTKKRAEQIAEALND